MIQIGYIVDCYCFVKIRVCYVLYSTIAKYLPQSQNSYKGFFERIRFYLVKGYVEKCGKFVNIQPRATIARRVSIGDFSGVGRDSLIGGGDKNRKACYDGARSLYIYAKS